MYDVCKHVVETPSVVNTMATQSETVTSILNLNDKQLDTNHKGICAWCTHACMYMYTIMYMQYLQ